MVRALQEMWEGKRFMAVKIPQEPARQSGFFYAILSMPGRHRPNSGCKEVFFLQRAALSIYPYSDQFHWWIDDCADHAQSKDFVKERRVNINYSTF
jgi:hypothetical protein